MHCTECGAEAPADARYCPQCGNVIAGTDAVAPSSTGRPADSPPSPLPPESVSAGPFGPPAGDDVEENLWEGGFSPRAMIGYWLAAAVVTLLLLGTAAYLVDDRRIWIALVALVLILWIGVYLRLLYCRWSVHYSLSNQRFIHEAGILRRVTDRVEMIDIDDITFEQGVLDRLMGVGTIRIVSSDRTHPELTLRGIADVGNIARLIDDTRRAERRKRGLHIEAI